MSVSTVAADSPMSDERLPLYAKLRDALAQRIAAMEWAAGVPLPAEIELAKAYDVAPGTMRKAIEQLVQEGLLERRQGSGTYVRRSRFDGSLFRFFRFDNEAAERGVPESRILRREMAEAGPIVSRALGLPDRAPVIRMQRLRLWSGEPFLAEDIFLPADRFDGLLDAPEEAMSPLLYPFYEERFRVVIGAVEEELSVGSADTIRARLLRMEPGAPLVIIDRLARTPDGQPVEWRRSVGRAERFRYKTTVR